LESALISNNNEIVKLNENFARMVESQSKQSNETIAIFDLSNSTGMKEEYGYEKAVHAIYSFVLICHNIILDHYHASIVKDLGDGVLARFKDPKIACNAAINVNMATRKYLSIIDNEGKKLFMKSKTILIKGPIQETKILGKTDIFGITVDMCARIEKITNANQILLDQSVLEETRDYLENLKDIQISGPMPVTLRGSIQEHKLYEISHVEYPLINQLNIEDSSTRS